jgi:hypothetical protein
VGCSNVARGCSEATVTFSLLEICNRVFAARRAFRHASVAPTTVARLRDAEHIRKRLSVTAEAVRYAVQENGGEGGYVLILTVRLTLGGHH